MSDDSNRWQELDSLLDRVFDGIYDDGDLRQLNALLRDDAEACRRYMLYVELHGRLAWGDGSRAEGEREIGDSVLEGGGLTDGLWRELGQGVPTGSGGVPPILIETAPSIPSSFSPLGSFLFSYAVAALTVAVGLMVGWAYQVSVSQQQIALEKSGRPEATNELPVREPEMVFVGQITGMFDVQWTNPALAAVNYAHVPLGRRYALASGLMEISYNSGARVILQGPCIYEVNSRTSGYLAVGKVTARVEKKAEGGRGKGEENGEFGMVNDKLSAQNPNGKSDQPSLYSTHQSPFPLPPSALFTVRTPTAVITDLGTEFGVEVDETGASRAHVFRGKVEMRVAGGDSAAVTLAANDSARVARGSVRVAEVVRQTRPRSAFVHEMPKSVPIAVFNTGIGLKGGGLDPHWQIVARSDDAKFRPRPAVVRGMKPDEYFLHDDPARSQWLSLSAGDRDFPEEVVFVFRTEFDLTGMLPSTAVLQGKFVADDRVVGIRLNGRRLTVPLHRDGGPFLEMTSFRIASGFVKGRNVLEFDVLNANPYLSPEQRGTMKSRVSFRAELEGGVTRDPGLTGEEAPAGSPQARLLRAKTAATGLERLEQGVETRAH